MTLLKLFNADIADLVPSSATRDDEIQNSLARLGATHLRESSAVLPSVRLREVGDVVKETLALAKYPRLITGLAPVIVRNIDTINPHHIHWELAQAGLQRRFLWLVDNTLEAVRRDRDTASRDRAAEYRRAEVVLNAFLESQLKPQIDAPDTSSLGPDVLDSGIRTKRSLLEVAAASSAVSKRWRIVSSIQPNDFVEALRATNESV